MRRVGRGDSDRPARGEQWVSALRQASMQEGAEQDEPRVEYRGCACRRQESLRRRRAESEGRCAARRGAAALAQRTVRGAGEGGEGRLHL